MKPQTQHALFTLHTVASIQLRLNEGLPLISRPRWYWICPACNQTTWRAAEEYTPNARNTRAVSKEADVIVSNPICKNCQ